MNKQMPWEEYPHIWNTEAKFMAWVRGGIRGGLWNKHPVKLEFLKKNRIRIPNPNPANATRFPEIWGGKCALTGKIVPLNQIEVDHKEGNHSLKNMDDIASFIKGIVLVCDDDLQLVSKDAHKIKSLSERKGITFEEAVIEKKVIAFGKLSADEQNKILTEIYERDKLSFLTSKSKRVEAYRQYLKGGNNE